MVHSLTYAAAAVEAAKSNPRVFLELSVNNTPVGRLVIELRADIVPKTAENVTISSPCP